jgi:hypothetical protein
MAALRLEAASHRLQMAMAAYSQEPPFTSNLESLSNKNLS